MFPVHRTSLSIIAALALGMATLAGAAPARAEASLTIGGTGSALGAMKQLAEAYMRSHPDASVTVLPSLGSNGGIKALRAGAIDISLTTEPLAEEHTAAGLTAVLYAKTALAFATRSDNPADAVTSEWIADVYRGEVTAWPDGAPIRLILRPAHDSDMKILFAFSDTIKQAMEAALDRPGLLIEDTAQGAGKKIEQLDGSLCSSTLAQDVTEHLGTKLLSFDGVAPTTANLASGAYPLVKTFYYVSRPDASPTARDFMAFLKSAEAAAILESGGNIAVSDSVSG